MQPIGVTSPSESEVKHGSASSVELFQCPATPCSHSFRFARYNHRMMWRAMTCLSHSLTYTAMYCVCSW
jgi:hypothetical protein